MVDCNYTVRIRRDGQVVLEQSFSELYMAQAWAASQERCGAGIADIKPVGVSK